MPRRQNRISTSSKKIAPQLSGTESSVSELSKGDYSDTQSSRKSRRDGKQLNVAASDEDFASLGRKMHMNCCCQLVRSIQCCIFLLISGLVLLSLCFSIVWFTMFFTTTERYGGDLRVAYVSSIQSELNGKMSGLRASGNAVLNSMAPVVTNQTDRYDILHSATNVLSGVMPEFTRLDMSMYFFDMMGGIGMANFDNPDKARGAIHWYTNSSRTLAVSNSLTYTVKPRELHLQPAREKIGGFHKMFPLSFVDHVKANHIKQSFTEPVPFLCGRGGRTSCVFVFFGCWFHFVDDTGLRMSTKLSISGASFSEWLTDLTVQTSAFSFLMTPTGYLVGASGGLKRIQEDEEKWRFYIFDTATNQGRNLPATQYPDPKLSSVSSSLHETFPGDTLRTAARQSQTVVMDGYHVDLRTITLNIDTITADAWPGETLYAPETYLNELILVHVIPKDAFTRSAIVSGVIMLCVTCVFGAISFLVSLLIGLCIIRPVRKLIRQMEMAKDLKLDFRTDKLTYFSELRKIQGHFYFMALNLSQYRAFLPSYVLKTIEEKNLAFTKHLDNKQPIRSTSDAETPSCHDDEVLSAHTSKSAGSARSSRRGGTAHQFQLGMMRRNLSIVRIQLIQVEETLKSMSLKDFVLQHSRLMELTEKLVSVTRSATLNSFTQESIVISLTASHHAEKACIMGLLLRDRILAVNEQFTQQALPPIRVVISVNTNPSFVSTLGTDSLKNRIIFGPALTRASMQSTSTQTLMKQCEWLNLPNCVVVANHQAWESVREKIDGCILDLLCTSSEGQESTTVEPMHQLTNVKQSNRKNMEWNYEMQANEEKAAEAQRNADMNMIWTCVARNDLKHAISLLQKGQEEQDEHTKQEERKLRDDLLSFLDQVQEEHNDFDAFCASRLNDSKRKQDRTADGESSWISVLSELSHCV